MTKKPRQHERPVQKKTARIVLLAVGLSLGIGVLSVLAVGGFRTGQQAPTDAGTRAHGNVDYAEAAELIVYNRKTRLTPEQRDIQREALTAVKAPCCPEYSADTCCCPCNLAKTIWGLSKRLIVEEAADVETVKSAVHDWIKASSPSGFPGDTCATGKCNIGFSQGGCGGMTEEDLAV